VDLCGFFRIPSNQKAVDVDPERKGKTEDEALQIGPNKSINLSMATLICIGVAIFGVAMSWFNLQGSMKDLNAQIVGLNSQIEGLQTEITNLKSLSNQIGEIDRRIYAVELQMKVHPGAITTTSQGGSVNLGSDWSRRQELKKYPKLRTSDLAFLLGVTNETVTNNIEDDGKGGLVYTYKGERHAVEKYRNTFLIENPFFDAG
jgi:cell division protein FtsL